MPAPLRHTLLSLRDLLSSVAPFVLLTLMLLALAYWWLDPMPPQRITLATGPAQSAYDELGKRYAQILKGYGIEVQLKPSQGAAHNLELLRQGEVDIAFVQGGTGVPTEDDELESLGSLFVEPVWFFYRSEAARKVRHEGTLAALGDLQGLRLNVGAEGSGVPRLMQRLFEANRIDPASMKLSRLDQTPAVMALLAGEIDALVLASAPESLMVQMLLQTPGVRLMDFSQSEAYARRFSFLTPVTLPRGVVDLARDIPAQDVRLIATTTTLLATPDVHPALLQLFSQASLRLHGPAGWFNRAREFPNAGQTEFPLAQEAERTLKSGVPLLQRYLSFTMANLLERMWLALGIILAILLPLSRIVPPLYTFRIRSRVFRWYAQLKQIEDRIQTGGASREELLQELQQLDARAARVKVPLSYAEELYALRQHISMVRGRLN
ncbi:MAG: TAXI family TRAP transporter solute-binding subunit [Hylemonella sp.]|uniref:TAXI family TRAP transporter solute-binding subunit n=1 Tax=Hylemonella sp. TaxID=2066020 RepID=UPI003919E120